MRINKPKRYYLKVTTKYYQNTIEVSVDKLNPDEYWEKFVFDNDNNVTYYKRSTGYWVKCEHNHMGKPTNYINSSGHWYKYEYDVDGKIIYYEDSNGVIHE